MCKNAPLPSLPEQIHLWEGRRLDLMASACCPGCNDERIALVERHLERLRARLAALT